MTEEEKLLKQLTRTSITQQELISAISSEEWQSLNNLATDRCAAFLSGQVSSIFNRIYDSDNDAVFGSSLNNNAIGKSINSTLSTAGKLIETTGAVSRGLSSTVGLFTQESDAYRKILDKLARVAIDRVSDIIKEKLQETTVAVIAIVNSIPTRIKQYTLAKFNEEKISYDEILSKLVADPNILKNAQDEIKQVEQEIKDKTKVLNTITTITTQVNNIINLVNTKIYAAVDYIEEGPDYVHRQIYEAVDWADVESQKYIDIALDWAEKFADKQAKHVGEWAGHLAANEFNKLVQRTAEKYTSLIKKETTKASVKINTAIQAVKLKILALLGK